MTATALRHQASNPSGVAGRIAAADWTSIAAELDTAGCAVLNAVLSAKECESLSAAYPNEKLFRSRSERQIGYCLRKELRAMVGDTIANYWEGEWQDSFAGKPMAGRGVEIWVMRDGKIAVWEAAFNFNEKGRPSAMGLT